MNFCTEALGTRIRILNKVAEEGYEAENLLRKHITKPSFFSSNSVETTTTQSGFMAARFVRSPLTIRLDFAIPIQISHIVLNPKLSQQMSTAFKIDAVLQNSPSAEAQGKVPVEVQIGREFLNGPEYPDTIVFKNPRFILYRKYSGITQNEFEAHRNHPTTFDLRHPTFDSCERVTSLLITILRTHMISVPVIQSLEVWGAPFKFALNSQAQDLIKAWKTFTQTHSDDSDVKTTDDYDYEPERKKLRRSPTPVGDHFPDEFLDPITFKVLSQPLRLPSGVQIDKETLEKYNLEESKWGRLPNDPFTGKIFTESSKPIPDLGLKARIETFLIQNNSKEEVKNLPRTLGSAAAEVDPLNQTSSNILSKPTQSIDLHSTSDKQSTDPVPPMSSKEFMELELARILGSSKAKPANDEQIRKTCSICNFDPSLEESRTMSVSVPFYTSPCNHTLICRNCVLIIPKNKECDCSFCSMKYTRKELSKLS